MDFLVSNIYKVLCLLITLVFFELYAKEQPNFEIDERKFHRISGRNLSLNSFKKKNIQTLISSTGCDGFDGMATECRSNGCIYCCSDQLCHQDKKTASDCFQTGCHAFCEDDLECNIHGCVFDYERETCGNENHGGDIRYSFNFCGSSGFDSNNIWYRWGETIDEPTQGKCQGVGPGQLEIISDPQDKFLFEKQFTSKFSVNWLIDFVEDGKYFFNAAFSEVSAQNEGRILNGYLENFPFFINFDTGKIKNNPLWKNATFVLTGDGKVMEINGSRIPLQQSNTIVFHVTSLNDTINRYNTLNAYYLQKIL